MVTTRTRRRSSSAHVRLCVYLVCILVALVKPTMSSKSSMSPNHHLYSISTLEKPRSGFFETVLEGAADQNRCKPTGLISDACCDFETVEEVNDKLATRLHDLVKTDFFRYLKVDLYKECPFWRDNDALCMNRACAVETTEEEDIPIQWRSNSLSKVKTAENDFVPFTSDDGYIYADGDFCVLEDENANNDGVYVDLLANPERFTGYSGTSAQKVWKAIYEENCFGAVPVLLPPTMGKESGGGGFVTDLSSTPNLHSLMGNLAGPRDSGEELCLEKRVFYRLISGLHASISIHICDEYLDQATGEWAPNLECFISRIAQHPERIENVYFDYVLFLRALHKAGDYLKSLDESIGLDQNVRQSISDLVDEASSCTSTFDETSMFEDGPHANALKQEFKEHFRNISRIMDCVGCDKCRLWGKTQIMGLGTALKLLFSFEDSSPDSISRVGLQRSEIVAFINTLNRLSESLVAVEEFRKLWAHRDDAQKKNIKQKEEPNKQRKQQEQQQKESPSPPMIKDSTQKTDSNNNQFGSKNETMSDQLRAVITKPGNVFQNVFYVCQRSVESCIEMLGRLMKDVIAKVEL